MAMLLSSLRNGGIERGQNLETPTHFTVEATPGQIPKAYIQDNSGVRQMKLISFKDRTAANLGELMLVLNKKVASRRTKNGKENI